MYTQHKPTTLSSRCRQEKDSDEDELWEEGGNKKMLKKKLILWIIFTLFSCNIGHRVDAQETRKMTVTSVFVRDGKFIQVHSGGSIVVSNRQRKGDYETTGINPFSYSLKGAEYDRSLSTKTKVKFSQTKEMEAAGEILVDATGEGYFLEYVTDIDLKTRTISKMQGLIGAHGCVIEYYGRVSYGNGLIIESSASDPLTFESDRERGNVYKKGTGVLRLPDGRSFTFPMK